MAMTISEIAERGLTINHEGRVMDNGNEYRDEHGRAHVLREEYQTLLESEYVAIYVAQDGYWNLLAVVSDIFMGFNPDWLKDFYDNQEMYILVPSDTPDMPDILND